MRVKFNYLIFICIVLLGLIIGAVYPLNISQFKVLGLNSSVESKTTLTAGFFAKKEFNEGILISKKIESEYSGNKIYGGIIPHHLLPGYILSDFFKKLAVQNPKRIILIGPNHHEAGGEKIITSSVNWETQFGKINSDYPAIESLIENGTLKENNEVAIHEHSIGGILHYIKYYIPEAKVIPIILSGTTTSQEVSDLATSLQKYIDDDTVIIASVDFSHYLSSPEAIQKDKITKKIMEEFNFTDLYRLNNDYVDSPASIGALLNVMQNENAKKEEILFNTNSGEILKNDSIKTTSYFSIFFTKE